MQHQGKVAIASPTNLLNGDLGIPSKATPIEIAGTTVAPGAKRQFEIPIARLPTQTVLSLPVTVANGAQAGPRLWLSAAIHGDELNGVEIIRRVLTQIDPRQLCGAIVAVPIVNVFGFIEQSRYLPDRRDLNRSFPGSARGSLASRLAYLFMNEIVSQCTHGIDLHTASHHRTNLPQIRANLRDPETYRCAKAFGTSLIVHAAVRDGSLRQAAAQQGIPILLYEGGEALRFDAHAIQTGVDGILRVMTALEMYAFDSVPKAEPSLEIETTKWIRASRSGILRMAVQIGDSVTRKQVLGTISDAFGDKGVYIRSPHDGILIGCNQNPLVNQGDGLFHIALVEPPDLPPQEAENASSGS